MTDHSLLHGDNVTDKVQKSLSWGIVPTGLTISEPYVMVLNSPDLQTVAAIVNQGIDSHLEAVFTRQSQNKIEILDSASMRCFLRRCVESDSEEAQSLASDIMTTLGYEWI